jgi:hypothetical protein
MALANYAPSCAKNVPGNKRKIYIAPSGTIKSLAETTGEISTLTAGASAFKSVKADVDSVQYTDDGTFSTSGGYTQTLIARFSKPSTALNALLDELRDGIACGFEIIHVDANSKVWLSGISIATKEGDSRPWSNIQIATDSGVIMTDENTQAVTVTFTRLSAYRPVELDDTLAAAVLDESAAYIDF